MSQKEIFDTLQYQYAHAKSFSDDPGLTFDVWLSNETDLANLVAQWQNLGENRGELAQFLEESCY